MCEQCEDLRDKMNRCRRLMDLLLDQPTIERFKALHADYEAQLQKIDCPDKKQ